MQILEYPFDSALLTKKRKSIKRELLAQNVQFLDKKIAILGGSTTSGIKDMLELFLLNQQIKPVFFESEYGQYWQDAMFNEELAVFAPDIIFIHTSFRNITQLPELQDSELVVNEKLQLQFEHFSAMWDTLAQKFKCPIIQNNMDRPLYRLLGNKDISDIHGATNFASRLNQLFYEYAQTHTDFYINDIDYLAAAYGLDKWHDPHNWYMYKYVLSIGAIPEFAFNVANIMKSIYGKNKKALVLDLDNTLWGGVVGDDGVENLALGPEVSMGQAFSEFQEYIKKHKALGITLNVCSKNDEENAFAGLNHPDSVLLPDDFIVIKANWEHKNLNIAEIASILNIGQDALVFVDDNPAERAIVQENLPMIAVPNIGEVEQYILRLNNAGYFEVTTFSADDSKRNEMYKQNAERAKMQTQFTDYGAFLDSLEMQAEIKPFEPMYIGRITQPTNKSNQFNLTTKRYTESEMTAVMRSDNHIAFYGRLIDKFGDNGIVSIVVGEVKQTVLHVDLWLMSCRVLKREMEFAMFDEMVKACKEQGILTICGYYYKTAKNNMVKDFYATLSFEKIKEDEQGNSEWQYNIREHKVKNAHICVNEQECI
ncbi:MAG: HAD-IIIC family phosphatase [Christensenellaceae bacterium]|jgi:FkbH-like protein